MAINPAETISVANGVAKRVHNEVITLQPRRMMKRLNRIPYTDKVGDEIADSVWLTEEHGFTFGGTTGAVRTLNEPEVAENKLATLTPSAIDFRTRVVIDLLSRAATKGEKAFERIVAAQLRNSKWAFDKRLEFITGYGGQPVSTVNAISGTGTTRTLTLTESGIAPGIWRKSRNMPIDLYRSNGTQINALAVANVQTVTFTSNGSTMAASIVIVGNATDLTNLDTHVAGDGADTVEIYMRGQKGNDFRGLYGIAALTTSDTHHGIAAANYPDVWTGTTATWTYGTTLTWETLQNLLLTMCGKGLEGDVIADCSLKAWTDLNAQLNALRVFDSSYEVRKAEQGHSLDAIVFHSINGKVTVEPNAFTKQGHVLVYPDPDDKADQEVHPKRIGSSNVTFQVPGRGDEMFKMVEDENTFEKRAFTDQALWLPAPCMVGALKP